MQKCREWETSAYIFFLFLFLQAKHFIQKITLSAFLRFNLGDKAVSVKADAYAQCQVVLLTLGLSECLLFVWQLESTAVFTIRQDPDWCCLMLRVLSQIHQQYVQQQKVPEVHGFGMGLDGYEQLLAATKAGCLVASATRHQVSSVKGNVDDRLFL